MNSTPQPNKTQTIKILFSAELIVIGILALTYNYLNELGAGGLVFILPLFIAYSFILAMMLALPILSIEVIKSKIPRTKLELIIAWFAGVTNSVAVVALVIAIIPLMVKHAGFGHFKWQDLPEILLHLITSVF